MLKNIKPGHRLTAAIGILLLALSISCAAPRHITYIVGVTATQDGVDTILKNSIYSLENVVIHLSNGDKIQAKKIIINGRTGEFKTDGIRGRIHASKIELLAPRGRNYRVKANDGAQSTDDTMVMHDALFSTGKATITARKILINWL